MGCATSKNQKVCRNCQAPLSPIRRSYSVHKTGEHPLHQHHHHVVALTSTTLGSLNLDPFDSFVAKQPKDAGPTDDQVKTPPAASAKEEFDMGMIEAKTWSEMINHKIPKTPPKTPTRTPPGEPESINAWEMMEGLEDISPLRPARRHVRSFSFQVPPRPCLSSLGDDRPTPRVEHIDEDEADESAKTGTASGVEHIDEDEADESNSHSNDTSIISDFDPDVIATFRKALEELPPANPFHLKAMGGIEKRGFAPTGNMAAQKLIVYFTSLRGVRKTYEDCCHVRVILNGLGVKVDERDVSMHSGFKEELKELSGGGGGLPRVFIGRECVGGADEIRRLNEEGTLEKLVEVCEALEDVGGKCGKNGNVCDACGDIRFVPCETCSGSCKIYYERDFEDEDEEEEVGDSDENECDYGFHRCPDCNENGLIRCPICCD